MQRIRHLYKLGRQPGTLSLDAAHNLNLTSLTTTDTQSTDLKKKDLAWQSVGGNGSIDQTTHTTQLNAAQLNLSAGNRITADMSVKDSAAVLASEPGMGWLKQLQTDPALNNKIDWNKIEQAHQHWNYKQQGARHLSEQGATVVLGARRIDRINALAKELAGSEGRSAIEYLAC